MSMRVPDFIIGGAPRSGTTWLYRLLERHPQVHMARPVTPEPKFFLVDEVYARGLGYYSATWFRDVPAERRAGEKSTNYLESPVAARRIRDALPSVRLVFILREPVERAFSNYRWSRRNGYEAEGFERALDLEPAREAAAADALRYARPHAYFSRGLYADLLMPYLELFGRERVLCLRFEDLRKEPRGLTARLHQFLDVERRPQDAEDLGVVNPSGAGPEAVPAGAREVLVAKYAEPNRRLYALLGAGFEPWEA